MDKEDAYTLIEENIERRRGSGGGANTLEDFVPRQERVDLEEATLAPTLAELAGEDGGAILREGIAFYPRSPKLRALDSIIETLDRLQAGGLKRGEAVMRTATLFLVVEETEETEETAKTAKTKGTGTARRRLATFDEIADSFDIGDVEMLARLAQKYLYLRVTPVETAHPKG